VDHLQLPCLSSHQYCVLNPNITAWRTVAQGLEIEGVMAGTQPSEIVVKVAGVKKTAGECVLLSGVPYLELSTRVIVVPGITEGTGRLRSLLQVGHIGTAAGHWFV